MKTIAFMVVILFILIEGIWIVWYKNKNDDVVNLTLFNETIISNLNMCYNMAFAKDKIIVSYAKGFKIFNMDGKLLHFYEKIGRAPDEILSLLAIAVDEENQVFYVLDQGNKKILQFDLKSYKFIKSYNLFRRVATFAITMGRYKGKNRIFLAGPEDGNVVHFLSYLDNTTGNFVNIDKSEIILRNKKDYLDYFQMNSVTLDNQIALFKGVSGKMLFFSLEKSDFSKEINLKKVLEKNQGKTRPPLSFSGKNNFIVIVTINKKLYFWSKDTNLKELNLIFDNKELMNNYMKLISKKLIDDDGMHSFKLFVSPYENKVVILTIEGTYSKIGIFSYKIDKKRS